MTRTEGSEPATGANDPPIYLDYNATAPLRPEVVEAVLPFLVGKGAGVPVFGNASSVHWAGREARRRLEAARATIAAQFGRHPSEVLFTSGATEADNLALFGVLEGLAAGTRPRLVLSAVEHPAVLESARRLKARGVDVEQIPVNAEGGLDLDRLEAALSTRTTLVSIMAANNETGVIFPSSQIVALAHEKGARVHFDAVQAVGRIPVENAADLISVSGHKLGGLKGSGALLTRKDLPLRPQILGGTQERSHRAGTEAVAHAVSLATAIEVALRAEVAERARLTDLRDRLERAILTIPGARVIGAQQPRLPQTTSALFANVPGEALLIALDLAGVAASSGSACASGSLEPSHVLLAMGFSAGEALSAVRFSLGHQTRADEIERVAGSLPRLVTQVRSARG